MFLINTPKDKVNIEDYPAICDWLLPFKPELEKRATRQEWFELQQAQLAYQPSLLVRTKASYGPFRQDERLHSSPIAPRHISPTTSAYFMAKRDDRYLLSQC